MASYRLTKIHPALWRTFTAKAGARVRSVLIGLMELYADGTVDPDDASPRETFARAGGLARSATMTKPERRTLAKIAARIRWDRTNPPTRDPRPTDPVLGWTSGDGSGHEGYTVAEYFDEKGHYRGPDTHGIEPIFDRAAARTTPRHAPHGRRRPQPGDPPRP